MYSTFGIQTRLSVADAEDVLARLVEVSDDRFTTKPFSGRVGNGTFTFRRVIRRLNDFLTRITGRIVQGEGGAVVRGSVRAHPSVAIVMTVWTAMAIIAVVNLMPRLLAESNPAGALGILVFPLFGVGLAAVGYYPERREALRLLSEAFQYASES